MDSSSSDLLQALLPPLWMRIVACIIGVIIATVGGVGNLTVLAAFAMHRSMWTKQNIFLFCLTISDLSMSTLVTAQVLEQYLSGQWYHSHLWCRVFLTIMSVSFTSSLIFVALISRDRMLMVTKGAAYDAYESARRKWLMVLVNCLVLPVALLPYTSLDIFTGVSLFATTARCDPEQLQSLAVTVANQLVITMTPFCFMLYYYARVRRYVRQRSLRVGAIKGNKMTIRTPATISTHAGVNNKNKSRSGGGPAVNIAAKQTVMEKTARAVRIMNALLISTFFAAIPATITSVVINVLMADPAMVTPATFQWWTHFYGLAFLSCFTSNAINPILYAYAMPSYREAARDVYLVVWRLVSLIKHFLR